VNQPWRLPRERSCASTAKPRDASLVRIAASSWWRTEIDSCRVVIVLARAVAVRVVMLDMVVQNKKGPASPELVQMSIIAVSHLSTLVFVLPSSSLFPFPRQALCGTQSYSRQATLPDLLPFCRHVNEVRADSLPTAWLAQGFT